MIYENILKIKDIIGSNFLSFQDGVVPTIRFVNPDSYDDNIQEFDGIIEFLNKSRKYEIECIATNTFGTKYQYQINPKYFQLDNGIAFVSNDWSIEEMIEIIVNLNK